MMWFFQHFWIFISYHIFLLNQVEGAIAIPPSNSASLPLFCLSVRLSVRLSVNRSVNHIFRFLHICWQVTGKEWHIVRNADVSRWLTLGQHWCRWVLLSFHALGQRRAVVIIGRWLLPSLVDTGDICCHYWQHILVFAGPRPAWPSKFSRTLSSQTGWISSREHIDGLVQERRNSSALAMELGLSCINPSILCLMLVGQAVEILLH